MSDMLVRLYDLPPATRSRAALASHKIVVRRARAYELHQVVPWVQERFPPGWGSEVQVAFSRSPITCFVAVQEGALLGFACCETTSKGFFGPTGVDEAARGKGVGTALLLTTLHAMAADGYAYAIIGGVGPKDFYARVVGAIDIPDSTPGVYRDRIRS